MAFPREERGSARCVISHVRIASITGFDYLARRAASLARLSSGLARFASASIA